MENVSPAEGAKAPVQGGGLPAAPLELVGACRLRPHDPIIDVSGSNSSLVEALLEAGYKDLTVIDGSPGALAVLSERCGDRRGRVRLVREDVTRFHPHRRYALWYDEAVFHSFTHPEERWRYVEALLEALRPEGHLVIRTSGPEGPEFCAGLPVRRYSAATLHEELGSCFELIEHFLSRHEAAHGEGQQFLHCRFRRHAAA